MKKINDKTIRGIIVVVGLALSFVLILIIGSKFKKEPVTESLIPQQSSETNDVVVVKPETTEKEKEITVPPITTSEKIDEDTAPIDKGTEQKIQEDVTKPEYTEDQLTDPTQKPTGEEVEPPTKDDSEIETTEPPQTESNPDGGLPGFDNVPDGGENQVIIGDSDGYINKQVGIMG